MILKRFLIWIITGLVLLLLTLLVLLALDFVFRFDWITDGFAAMSLMAVFVIHLVVGIIKFVCFIRKSKGRHKRAEKKNKKIKIGRVIAVILVIEMVISVALKMKYDSLLEDSFIDVPEKVIELTGCDSLFGGGTKGVPDEIVEFGKKYPEAKGYVRDYNKYKNVNFDMDVSSEMAERDIPLFIQWDKRWGYRDYGGNYIGVAGCGPTCLAMVVCGLEKNDAINPYDVGVYSASSGYYTYGEGTSWSMMTEGAEHYGLNVSTGNVSVDYILNNLSETTPMICSMTKGDFTTTGHFIVLTDIDDDGKVVVNDPNSPKNSKKHWDADVLVSQMKSIWRYSA